MDTVRARTRSLWPILSRLSSYAKSTFKEIMVDHTGGLRCWIPVYKQLIAAEADEALQLTSATDGSSTSFCFQLNRLLAEILGSCAKDPKITLSGTTVKPQFIAMYNIH